MTDPGWVIMGKGERQIVRQGRRFIAIRNRLVEPLWRLEEIDPETGRWLRTLAVKVFTKDLDSVLEALAP
jgi:hypothetical protein